MYFATPTSIQIGAYHTKCRQRIGIGPVDIIMTLCKITFVQNVNK